MATATPEPANPEDLAPAFALLFADLQPDERERRVAVALELVGTGELNAAGVFVLREGGKLSGVAACQPLAGAGALVWPPRVTGTRQVWRREDDLLRKAERWLRDQGTKLAQCLLLPEETPLAASLTRNGFRHIGHLLHLRHSLQMPVSVLATPNRLEFHDHAEEPGLFRETLLRTYEGSLDCPELSGTRTIDEILTGHAAQGTVRRGHWALAKLKRTPAGVLLVVEHPDSCGWEIVYAGIVPELRRQGLGRELMLYALTEARAADAAHLNLSVDGRNSPARKLYKRLGFEVIERREVYLAVWSPPR